MPAFDFNALLNGLSSLAGVAAPFITAGENRDAAGNFANQTSWSPSPITLPGLGLAYNPSTGGYLGNITDSTNQGNAQQLYNLGGTLLDRYSSNPSMLPMLQNEFNTSNASMAGMSGAGSYGAGLETVGRGFLSSLGSFDPNQLAASYANNLRAAARPAEQNAAQAMAQQLFNTGRLGSTGGANLMGNLAKQLEEADIQRTIAGQQLAGQEQSRMFNMAGQAGQLGQALQMSPTQQRFQNAMQLFGAGQTEQSNTLNGALSAIGLGTQTSQLDIQNLISLLAASGSLSASRSVANANAYRPGMEADVAQNNTIGSALGGLEDIIGRLREPLSGLREVLGLGAGAAEGLTGALPAGAGSALSQLAPNATSSLPSGIASLIGGAEGLTGALPAGAGAALNQLAPNALTSLPASLGGAAAAGGALSGLGGVTIAPNALTALPASLGGSAALGGSGATAASTGGAAGIGGLGAAATGLGIAGAAYGVFSLLNGFAKNVGDFSIDPNTGRVTGSAVRVAGGKTGRNSTQQAAQDRQYEQMLTNYLQTGTWVTGPRGVGDGGRAVRAARQEIDKFRESLGLAPGQPVPPGTFGG